MILSIVNELIFKFPPNKQMLQLFFRNIPHVHLHEKRRTRNTIVELKFKLSSCHRGELDNIPDT